MHILADCLFFSHFLPHRSCSYPWLCRLLCRWSAIMPLHFISIKVKSLCKVYFTLLQASWKGLTSNASGLEKPFMDFNFVYAKINFYNSVIPQISKNIFIIIGWSVGWLVFCQREKELQSTVTSQMLTVARAGLLQSSEPDT